MLDARVPESLPKALPIFVFRDPCTAPPIICAACIVTSAFVIDLKPPPMPPELFIDLLAFVSRFSISLRAFSASLLTERN